MRASFGTDCGCPSATLRERTEHAAAHPKTEAGGHAARTSRRLEPRAISAFTRVCDAPVSGAALQSDRAPQLFPVVTVLVGDATVLGEELVRDLEHRDHDAAFGRRRRVAAAGLAPHELAGADGQALGR